MEIHIAKPTQRNFCAMENMTLQRHNVNIRHIFFDNMSNSPRIVTQRTTVRKQLIIGQCTVLRTVNMCLWAPKYQSIWASEHPGIWTFKHPSLKMGWIVPLYNCSTYYREAFHCSSLVFPTWSSRRRRESADLEPFSLWWPSPSMAVMISRPACGI